MQAHMFTEVLKKILNKKETRFKARLKTVLFLQLTIKITF